MSAFLWFMLGLSIGSCVGFLLFACLQVSRDSGRLVERQWSKLDRNGKMTTNTDRSLSAHNSRFRADAAGC
jgi:hypothetical protein